MNPIWFALIFAVGVVGVVAFALVRARRLHHESQLLKEEIRKWEDEGGNGPQPPIQTRR